MKDFVTGSRILRRMDLYFFGGRKYREFEIASGESFEAGQYLMIRTKNREVSWPYPYFIHRRTAAGLVVLAREDQDLYNSAPNDFVEYWGPQGTAPVDGKERPILVAEPAVCFALYPFLCRQAYRRLIITGPKFEDAAINPESARYCSEIGEAEYCSEIGEAVSLLGEETGPVIAAFNPAAAKIFAENTAKERKKDTYIFVSNKKACGMDGCKGCYLHSGDTKFGINVCCKGPFMPLDVINFEADGRCFETFL